MNKRLNFIGVATMYVGVIMGAGFASGRECWQFFGIFGSKGYIGIILNGIGFLLIAAMLNYVAISKNTIMLGELISPFKSVRLSKAIGLILAIIYYTMLIAMSSAGGALVNQVFGMPQWIGVGIITVLTLLTVLGDFSRVSEVFKRFVPMLFAICILAIILVLSVHTDAPAGKAFKPGGISPNWQLSALLFLSYNSLGMIAMAGSSAVNAKNSKHAYLGAALGLAFLTGLTLMLLTVLLKGPEYSSTLGLPMVGWASLVNRKFGYIYAVALMGAIYQTSCSTYYGFSTTIKKGKYKKYVLIVGAVIGFVLGLTDFKDIVGVLYPAQGYIGWLILLLISLNFFNELINNTRVVNNELK